jgi:hypothetical protein
MSHRPYFNERECSRTYREARDLIGLHLRDIKLGLAEFHKRAGPSAGDEFDWTSAGSLQHFEAQLRAIADEICRRGEYAPETMETSR